MGTKNNPGPYDCYGKADPDEPLFTLRAKDPIAPFLVELWVATRRGQWEKTLDILSHASMSEAVLSRVSTDDYDKLSEAQNTAEAMRVWRARLEMETTQ
jgi:hypothetical protein